MAYPQIEKLLIVQDRDIAFQKIEQELAYVPKKLAEIEKLIRDEKENIDGARFDLKQKEVQRNEIEIEVKTKESNIARFRNQQLEVKRNEEYRALTQQIEQSEEEISMLEEREIELMLEIDTTEDLFMAEKAIIEKRIVEQNKQIILVEELEKNLDDSARKAETSLKESRKILDKTSLEHYDRVKKLCKRFPYVVRIDAHKCTGCHLRVSNEVMSLASNSKDLSFCDQCGRIVYI